jgi:formamidopyrimidine-DNA glycosylase
MPELPEVETVVRGLRDVLTGRTIVNAVFIGNAGRMTNIMSHLLTEQVSGQAVRSIDRRAKYIICSLDRGCLLVHLKMTGRLYVRPAAESDEADRWLRVRFGLDDGMELRFSDARRFGRVYYGEHPDELLPDLGPEPLEDSFSVDDFSRQLTNRKGALKRLLLDQSFVAGVGNIYADEALFLARLHPLRTADTLTTAEIARLYLAVRETLNDGIAHQGASVNWYRQADGSKGEQQDHLRVYHDPRIEKDKRCPECGTPISTIRVSQRGTHFCPTCQKL